MNRAGSTQLGQGCYIRSVVRVIVLKSDEQALSLEEAAGVVTGAANGQIISRDDEALLVEVEPASIDVLRVELQGWSVMPQGSRTRIPLGRLRAT